jgi:hypothetical protein
MALKGSSWYKKRWIVATIFRAYCVTSKDRNGYVLFLRSPQHRPSQLIDELVGCRTELHRVRLPLSIVSHVVGEAPITKQITMRHTLDIIIIGGGRAEKKNC